MQVALGSRDAQTLALTEDGTVYSWGDGDFGKLGRGGSDGCNVPHVIDRLNGLGVSQIECGAQFSLALTKSGQVWTWSVTTLPLFCIGRSRTFLRRFVACKLTPFVTL